MQEAEVMEDADLNEPDIDSATGKHRCQICGNVTANRVSFLSHRLRKHGPVRKTLVCPAVAECSIMSPTLDSLRQHLQENHNLYIQNEKRTFGSKIEFFKWKEEIEKKTNSQFVRQRLNAEKSGSDVFYCNRSGQKKSHHAAIEKVDENEKKKRAPRGKGSEKMGTHCPSSISVKYLIDGTIEVDAFLSHIGHAEDICFLTLSNATREKIRLKLQEGFAPDRIAEFIRKDPDSSDRDRMVRTREVLNILRLQMPWMIGYFDKDDHISIDMAVRHYSKEGDKSPLFYYRARSKDCETFALGIQTLSQRKILDQFSGNVVCLDTTHKPCQYEGYLLGTVLVLDSTGAGQPVVWFLIRDESEAEMQPIFEALKQRHPHLRPSYFMTDCANSFWNAWKAVFGHEGTARLWCKWHVWRAWSRHISKVAEESRRRELRQMLKNLIQASTKDSFDLLYHQYGLVMKKQDYLIVSKNKESRTFGEYFDREYGKNGRVWSRFGRLDCDIATNMHLESFHRTLKKRYLQRMCNRRIDYVTHILINKVAPDFAEKLEWTILMRGKSSTYQERVSHDHNKADYLLSEPTKITEVKNSEDDNRKWMVPSSTGIGCYEIKRLNDGCVDQCHISCQFCHVCPHQYSCTCPRFSARGRMPCKHVHAIHVLFDGSEDNEQSDAEDDQDQEEKSFVDLPQIVADEHEPPNETSELQAAALQLEAQATSIASYLQRWKALVAQCDSFDQLRDASTTAGHIEQLFIASIDQLRVADNSSVLPIGQKIRKHLISPQRATSNVLPLAKKRKASHALSTAEKDANTAVQSQLSELSRVVLPICSVCDDQYDSRHRITQKCPLCDCWRHDSCFHVCAM